MHDPRGKFIGQALYAPASEIRLRLLERSERPVDDVWWREQLGDAARRRSGLDATAFRLVHGEGDGLPSLVVDRYDRWLVVQILSAGLETMRETIVAALVDLFHPDGILLRNDVPVRKREGLSLDSELAFGAVPERIEVREGAVRYLADPWHGQKTGAFLDQRENRLLAGRLAPPGGRALDCFTYHGSFAIHLAGHSASVLALDSSREALERGAANAALNRLDNIEWREGDVFEMLRVVRPRTRAVRHRRPRPAGLRQVAAPPSAAAIRGYHEINLRAMRCLAPGGLLITASCSFHVRLPAFLAMLEEASCR